jgi:hypothetical protein
MKDAEPLSISSQDSRLQDASGSKVMSRVPEAAFSKSRMAHGHKERAGYFHCVPEARTGKLSFQ